MRGKSALISPQRDWIIDIALMAAVSALNILGPIETRTNLFLPATSISLLWNPPSGPIKISMFLSCGLISLKVFEDVGSRIILKLLLFSFMNSSNNLGFSISGMKFLPHCSQALRAIFSQWSFFNLSLLFLILMTEYFDTRGTITFTPN